MIVPLLVLLLLMPLILNEAPIISHTAVTIMVVVLLLSTINTYTEPQAQDNRIRTVSYQNLLS